MKRERGEEKVEGEQCSRYHYYSEQTIFTNLISWIQ